MTTTAIKQGEGFPDALRVAYLLSRYPAVSHTFFLKEVLGLRHRGMDIEVASINAPDRPMHQLSDLEAREAEATFYVKSRGMLSTAFTLIKIGLTHPVVVLRGLGATFKLGGLDLYARAFSLLYLAEALLVGDWMLRREISHLHVHFGGPVATVGMLTSQAWKIPWSLTLHGPDEFFDQQAFYLEQKIESSQFTLCISDFCRSQVLRISPQTQDSHVEVVRLGVDCESLCPSVQEIQRSCLTIVCTGRMVAAKGHRILIQALAGLRKSGLDFHCALIGDGPERSALEEQCRFFGLERKVQFLGAQAHEPTLALVATADVFVLASFAEGLPVALMEAMALGVPCVSTTIAAIPELIQTEENGVLVPPANVEALQAALLRVGTDADLRRRLGRGARTSVVTHYNLAHNLDLLASTWRHRLKRSAE